MNKFKVGDCVRVYSADISNKCVFTVNSIVCDLLMLGNGIFKTQAHYKQCRRLVRKSKKVYEYQYVYSDIFGNYFISPKFFKNKHEFDKYYESECTKTAKRLARSKRERK